MEQLRVKDLYRSGQTELMLKENYTFSDLPLKEPVALEARVNLNTTGVTLVGQYYTVIEEACDRCSEPFERTLYGTLDERFVYESLIDPDPAGDMELHSEDFYDVLSDSGILDLRDLLRQHLIMGISVNRVCDKPTCEF